MEKRRVSELMNPDVLVLGPKSTVGDARRRLAARGVSGAPVVDEAGGLLGIITQNDLARFSARPVTAAESGRFYTDQDDYRELGSLATNLDDTPVERIMSKPVFTVGRKDGVAIAANIMRERKIHRLVVIERGRLVGIISSLDLMRVVEELC
jgi:CBS domain-containing protein